MVPSRHRRLLALFSLFPVVACSGGGGGSAPPAHDLTGYWQLYLTPASSAEVGPLPVYLAQTGAAIDGVSLTGAMNGASVSMNADAGTFQIALAGTAASADSLAGNVTLSGGIVGSGTFHLERFQPTGTMSVSGTLDGAPFTATSSNAIGVRTYSDTGLTALTDVTLVCTDAGVDFEIELDASGLAVGALAVPGVVTAQILRRIDGAIYEGTAGSGTVTLTQYDSGGIAGSFTLTAGSDTITGSFDLGFDIESYYL